MSLSNRSKASADISRWWLCTSIKGNFALCTSCSGTTSVALGSPVKLVRNIDSGPAGITEMIFNIVLPDSVALLQGSSIEMTINNNSGKANKSIIVHPIWNSYYSTIDLNSETVIEIETLNAYDTIFSGGGSIPSSFLPGDTAYLRTTISDPFGNYDITDAKIDIINPNGITILSGISMGDAEPPVHGAAERTYEYPFDTTSYPNGVWTARVTAVEGAENIVTDVETVLFVVIPPMPDLTVVKSVLTYSDPVNNTTNPKAIPGADVTYTIMITNTGPVGVDNDSFVITDSLPPNTELYFNSVVGSGSAAAKR